MGINSKMLKMLFMFSLYSLNCFISCCKSLLVSLVFCGSEAEKFKNYSNALKDHTAETNLGIYTAKMQTQYFSKYFLSEQ